ncbi:hypothetical protein EJ065_7211 [Corallococcus coralloides]|uniref:Lipoprotein n=1 Tax=Corallococcus coralloides TaxID=184914 RepID=A0A410S3T1_CORCK|nr:hypothetical protein [Corallococcus coralloides]QAT88736.1 hypothetical protein EJ065_7211 [Corallococcus coralloides]
MKSLPGCSWLALALCSVLTTGCATATCIDSETCCVEAHPGNPAACGLTDAEAAALLGTAAVGAAAVGATLKELDDPNEGWRQHCIDRYVQCKDSKKPRWLGDCYACLRNCEGQKQWPFDLCRPRRD